MSNPYDSTCITIPGKLLVSNFSVYVIEITLPDKGLEQDSSQHYYYVGMTSYNHYCSARAAFYKLGGHLEWNGRNTQNQLLKGLARLSEKGKFEGRREFDEFIKNANICMYPFIIDGFKSNNSKYAKEDEDYLKLRREVNQLERFLINLFRAKFPNQILNKEKVISTNLPDNPIIHKVLDKINAKFGLAKREGIGFTC